MEEPIDFRTINGLSVGFNILDRSKNRWSLELFKKYENGQAVYIDISIDELKILKRELDKFLD